MNIIELSLCFMVFIILFLFFMLGRDDWLYDKHVALINNDDYKKYKRLWSYKKMMLHFWIWDIDKMMDGDNNDSTTT